LFLRATPSAQTPPAVGSAEAGHADLTNLLASPQSRPDATAAFVDLLIRTGELPLLFTVLDANASSQPFVVSCIKLLAKAENPADLFTPEVLVQRWRWLEAEFDPDELDALTTRLTKETDLVAHMVSREFDVHEAALYASLVRAGAASKRTFSSWCRRGLQTVDHAEWASQFGHEGDLLELLVDLLERRFDITLDLNYMDALADHAKAVMAGTSIPSHLLQSWPKLLTPLPAQRRKTLRRKIYDAAATAGNIHEAFFRLYGDEIADPDILRQDPQAPYKLFVPVLQSRNIAGLTWLKRVLPTLSPLEDQSFAPDTILDFKDRVRQALSQQQGTETDALIQQIAQILKIRLSTDDEPDQAG
jgi:hypothetical protein